jgi:hypothetical protein
VKSVEGYSSRDSVYSDLCEEGREAVSVEATYYFEPDFVCVFGGISEGEYSRGCSLAVLVGVGQVKNCKLKPPFFDGGGGGVFHQGIFVVEQERVFFSFRESGHGGGGRGL